MISNEITSNYKQSTISAGGGGGRFDPVGFWTENVEIFWLILKEYFTS